MGEPIPKAKKWAGRMVCGLSFASSSIIFLDEHSLLLLHYTGFRWLHFLRLTPDNFLPKSMRRTWTSTSFKLRPRSQARQWRLGSRAKMEPCWAAADLSILQELHHIVANAIDEDFGPCRRQMRVIDEVEAAVSVMTPDATSRIDQPIAMVS